MKLVDFLTIISSEKKLPAASVIGFSIDTIYPLLWTRLCIVYIQKNIKKRKENIDVKDISFNEAKARLTTSFLGETLIYMLYGFFRLDSKEKKKWINFLRSYSGPHTVIIFGIEKKQMPVQGIEIEIPENFLLQDAILFLTIFSRMKKNKIEFFLSQCMQGTHKISLESLCLITEYSMVIGNSNDFFSKYVPRIFPSKVSLFQLSQYLLEKNPKKFFSLYKKIEQAYSATFWTVFWSEQFWRAYGYVYYMYKNNIKNAKYIGTRLPFSFLHLDWKRYQPSELINAHYVINQLDRDIKRNRGSLGLELFYAQFLYSEYK